MSPQLVAVIQPWLSPTTPAAPLLTALLLANALLGLLFAVITQGLLPRRLREHPTLNVLTLSAFASLLPLIGPLLLLTIGLVYPLLKKAPRRFLPKLLTHLTYATEVQGHYSHFGAGGALARLHTAQSDSAQGSRALLAIESQRSWETTHILNTTLSHPDESLRLLAHHMLVHREAAIVAPMSRLEAQLGINDELVARTALELSELHLEFISYGMVSGSLRKMHIDHAQQLLSTIGEPPAEVAWHTRFLLVRARLMRQRGRATDQVRIAQDYTQALTAGVAPARALPWLLEQAWQARDYTRMHTLLAHYRLYTQIPLIGPVAARWERRTRG